MRGNMTTPVCAAGTVNPDAKQGPPEGPSFLARACNMCTLETHALEQYAHMRPVVGQRMRVRAIACILYFRSVSAWSLLLQAWWCTACSTLRTHWA